MDLQSLYDDLKETKRRLKILDEAQTDTAKAIWADVFENRNNLKAVEKKVLELEKKQKK
jgi:hypothetical protein